MSATGIILKKINNRLEAGKNRNLKEFDITRTQLDFLIYLYKQEEKKRTVSDIAAFFDIRHTSVLHVLKILEEKELIYRESGEKNPRYKHICLTHKSKELVQKVEPSLKSEGEILLKGFSEAEITELNRLLCHLYENIVSFDMDRGDL